MTNIYEQNGENFLLAVKNQNLILVKNLLKKQEIDINYVSLDKNSKFYKKNAYLIAIQTQNSLLEDIIVNNSKFSMKHYYNKLNISGDIEYNLIAYAIKHNSVSMIKLLQETEYKEKAYNMISIDYSLKYIVEDPYWLLNEKILKQLLISYPEKFKKHLNETFNDLILGEKNNLNKIKHFKYLDKSLEILLDKNNYSSTIDKSKYLETINNYYFALIDTIKNMCKLDNIDLNDLLDEKSIMLKKNKILDTLNNDFVNKYLNHEENEKSRNIEEEALDEKLILKIQYRDVKLTRNKKNNKL